MRVEGGGVPYERYGRFPASEFLGYDLSEEAVAWAREHAGRQGLGTMWGRERATSMLEDAGFGEIEIHELEHDLQNDFYVVRH